MEPTHPRLLSKPGPPALLALAALALTSAAAHAELSFTDQTQASGLIYTFAATDPTDGIPMHAGMTPGDFDNDGWIDLYIPSGGDSPAALFINNQDGTFSNRANLAGLEETFRGNGTNAVDYDNDGDMDIVIGSSPIEGPGEGQGTGEYRLYRNETVGSGADFNWLKIHLDSSGNPALPPHGWGTVIELRRDALRQYRRITAGSNYLSRSELVAHFGLGSTDAVDLVIEWPDGFRTLVADVAANQAITVAAEKPYDHGDLVRGETLQMTVNGLGPGEKAFFMYSVLGPGQGPCFEAAGGLCLDLLSPMPLGTKIADGAGTAVFQLAVPMNAPDGTFYTQVAVVRGQDGRASLKSNVVEADVVDP